MTLVLLLRYWREAVIGALVIALMASCVSRDHRIAAKAAAKEQTRQADSVLKVVIPQLAMHDTLLVHDTVKVRVAIDRVVTMRDTVLRHLSDTVLVREYVTRADSAAKACNELSSDCAAFRAYATQTIAALTAKANAGPVLVTRSCVAPSVTAGIVSAAAGFFIGRRR